MNKFDKQREPCTLCRGTRFITYDGSVAGDTPYTKEPCPDCGEEARALGVRSERFNDTTGALSWNYRHAAFHPDACVCNAKETGAYTGTPHKHYGKPPYACARCRCPGYTPSFPDLRVLDGLNVFGRSL